MTKNFVGVGYEYGITVFSVSVHARFWSEKDHAFLKFLFRIQSLTVKQLIGQEVND